MIGLSELLIPGIIFLLIVLFGTKSFLKFYRDVKGVRKEMKDIDKEFEDTKN